MLNVTCFIAKQISLEGCTLSNGGSAPGQRTAPQSQPGRLYAREDDIATELSLHGRTALQAMTLSSVSIRGRCPRLLIVLPSRQDTFANQTHSHNHVGDLRNLNYCVNPRDEQ